MSWFRADLSLPNGPPYTSTLVNTNFISGMTRDQIVFADGRTFNYKNVTSCNGMLIAEIERLQRE